MKHREIWANLSSIIGRIEQIEESPDYDPYHHRLCNDVLDQILGEANEILGHLEDYLEENDLLRSMLARSYSGPGKLYCDDGELQDNSERPFIDFKRDGAEDIQRKMEERSEQWLLVRNDEIQDMLINILRKRGQND